MDLSLQYQDIVDAHARIRSLIHKTPVLQSRTLNQLSSATVHLKAENFQRMGAFKFRGACNALLQFSDEQKQRGVVTFSSGNHAQAIALAARELGMRAVIVMPQDAPAIKIEATKGYGGEVILYDRYTEDREAIGRSLAEQYGLCLIPPYDHPHVMAGQGSAAKELFEDVGGLDFLIVPLGGGGLLSGCAMVAKTLFPQCTVIGVEPEAGNDGQRSFMSGTIIHIDTPKTIADGAQTQHLGRHTFPVIQQYVDRIETVSDDELVAAMHFAAGRMKVILEPTACLGLALVLRQEQAYAGKRVGVLLSGGNIDLIRFCELIEHQRKISSSARVA